MLAVPDPPEAASAQVQAVVFLGCHRVLAIGADIQSLGMKLFPLPVGETHLGAQQP